MSESNRISLTPEQAIDILPAGPFVHTFMQAGPMLIGADWERAQVEQSIRENTCELAGQLATDMGHGLVILEKRGAVFVATDEEKLKRYNQ